MFLVLLRLHLRSESACVQVVYVGLYASMLANSRILTACNLYYLHSFIPLHESINRRISSFNSHTKNLIDCVGFPDSFMDHLTTTIACTYRLGRRLFNAVAILYSLVYVGCFRFVSIRIESTCVNQSYRRFSSETHTLNMIFLVGFPDFFMNH